MNTRSGAMRLVLPYALTLACSDDAAADTDAGSSSTDGTSTTATTSPSMTTASTTDVGTTTDTAPMTSSSDDTTMGGSMSTSLDVESTGSTTTAADSSSTGTDSTSTGDSTSSDTTAPPDTMGEECGVTVFGDGVTCGVQLDCAAVELEMVCTIGAGSCICVHNGANVGGCALPMGLCDMGMGAYFEHAATCCGFEI